MTPEERNMLNELADNVSQAPAPARDPEAEDIIRTKIGKRPDALYMMTQTVLIQNMAIQRLQQQVKDLQSRAGQPVPSGGGSFLGNQPGYSQPSQPQYAQAPPQYAQPQYAPPSGGGGSSFLRGAAQTAAGVAAGTLAAEAIGSMFSPHGGGMFGGSGLMGGGSGAPTEEVVNNYYDSPRDDYRADDSGRDNFVDPGDANASDVNASDDGGNYDDNAQYDDASLDDSGVDNSGDDGSFLS